MGINDGVSANVSIAGIGRRRTEGASPDKSSSTVIGGCRVGSATHYLVIVLTSGSLFSHPEVLFFTCCEASDTKMPQVLPPNPILSQFQLKLAHQTSDM